MKKTGSMCKRIMSFLLAFTLAFGSASDLFPEVAAALAEGEDQTERSFAPEQAGEDWDPSGECASDGAELCAEEEIEESAPAADDEAAPEEEPAAQSPDVLAGPFGVLLTADGEDEAMEAASAGDAEETEAASTDAGDEGTASAGNEENESAAAEDAGEEAEAAPVMLERETARPAFEESRASRTETPPDESELGETAPAEDAEEEAVLIPAADADREADGQAETAAVTAVSRSDAALALLASNQADSITGKLQQMISDRIKSAETLNARITLILKKDTTYEGDISIEKETGKDYGEDFGVDLIAEDAGDDGLQAGGTTVVSGDIAIKGINVRLVGLIVAAGKKITVQEAKLEYSGTKEDDAVTVEMNGGEADIQTGAGKDAVTLTMNGGRAGVDTGAGDDTVIVEQKGESELTLDTGDGSDAVTAVLSGMSSAEIDTGDGVDTVNAEVRTGSVEIETGAGEDTVTVSVMDSAVTEINTGEDGDTVKLTADATEGKTALYTGDGNDTVTLDARTAGLGVTVSTGDGNDTVTVENTAAAGRIEALDTGIEVDLGSGFNDITVDVGISDGVKKITVNGEDGNDRLHLTGSLDEMTAEDQRASGTETDMKLVGTGGKKLNVVTSGVESVTDDLENKRTVTLTPGASGTMEYTAGTAFTNYIINAPSGSLKSVTIRSRDGQPMPLSNVVIDTDTAWNGESRLTISEGAVIDVLGLNLVIRGRNIEINGTVKADLVQVEALDGTGMHSRNFSDQYAAYRGAVPIEGLDQAASAITAAADLAWDLVNISDKATISIGKTAEVYASGDVLLLARVEQSGMMLSGIPSEIMNVNVVNVKVASASVDIAGKVCAGYDFEAGKTRDGGGSVKADAQVKTSLGYDDNDQMADGLPLAVSVASADTRVSVGENAVIEAARDISFAAKSELRAATRADSGLGGLPVSVAVAVLVNSAEAAVNGALTAGGDISVTADGDLDARTLADKGEGHKSLSGGYLAVTVALQDVSAKLGQSAVLNAGGGAQAASSANEKVENIAASSQKDSEEEKDKLISGAKSFAFDFLKDKLWPLVKGKISSETAQEKLDKAVKKVSAQTHAAELDENAQSNGTVTVEERTGEGAGTYLVKVEPLSGYKVKAVTWRGYNPGDSVYKKGAAMKDGDGAYIVTPVSGGAPAATVIISVEYEEDRAPAASPAPDLFAGREASGDVDVSKLLNDSTGGASGGQEENNAAPEEKTKIALTLKGTGGAVLTYATESDGVSSLSQVAAGDEIRIVPNPDKGNKLKEGGLKVTYQVEEEGKKVSKAVIVDQDEKGYYTYRIPDDVWVKGGITISGAFTGSGSSDAAADETQTQVTGAIAVTVADNDSQALIGDGASVTAGGKTDVTSNAETDIVNSADGSSVSKAEGSSGSGKSDGIKPISRPASMEYSEYDRDTRYGVIVNETRNGTVKAVHDKNYAYTFTAAPAEGYALANVLLTYYKEGEPKTDSLTADADGTFSLDFDKLGMDQGSTARVSVSFAREGVYGETVSFQEAQALLANPIRIVYNALKDEKENTFAGYTGHVYYKETKKDKNGKLTAYVFDAVPDSAAGYVQDGKLKASWTDAGGTVREAELERRNDGLWYLEPKDIPAGAAVTVTGVFKEDFHALNVDKEKTKNGTVTLYDAKVKRADAPKFTVKADAGYSITDVIVTYNQNGVTRTIRLSDKNSKITLAKDEKGKEMPGVYTFTVPELTADSKISVSAEFRLKTIGIYAGADDKDKDYTLSEKNAAPGDQVTVTPSADKAKKGFKVSKVVVTDQSGNTVLISFGGAFTVPKDTAGDEKLTVTVELIEKSITLEETKLKNGTVIPDVPLADPGDTITVTIKPDKDFKVKKGTLKAVVKAVDGSFTEEVYMNRKSDTAYTFMVPEGVDAPKIRISFVGEFEPGQSDSSALNTSLGAAAAVTVANSESRAEIMGGVTAKGNITVKSAVSGEAKTEAKAGYSKGNIGIGGAVAVQVASMDSKALIHDTADLKLDGKLNVSSSSGVTFAVSANASGSKEAKKAGVGAGIAVAVNGADAFAAVKDGAKLSANKKSAVKAVSVTAKQKLKDTVSAKAGAKGGTAVVPVAAVDVTGAVVRAYMGRIGEEKLTLNDGMSVSASASGTHKLTADASAAGKGAGIGAAISVSVISDSASARLNQSVSAEEAAAAAETVSEVSSTATASASGGKAEDKNPDKQADGLLDGAAKAAGKNKSSGVSADKIADAAKNRQKAETSEDTVGVAGAVAVNVQASESVSEIMDGVDIAAKGLAAVTALNGTAAKVKANGSTTDSDVGVGVGVAVNIIHLNNIARLGDGEIEAAMLKVAAATKMKEPEEEKKKDKADDMDGLAKQLGEAVEKYINDLVKELGLDRYIPEKLLGEIMKPVVENTLEELIKATGLSELLGEGDLSEKYANAKSLLTDAKDGLLALPDQLLSPFLETLEDVIDLSTLTAEDWARIRTELASELNRLVKERVQSAGEDILNEVKDGMLAYLEKEIGDILSGLVSGQSESTFRQVLEKAKTEIGKAVKKKIKAVVFDSVKDALLNAHIPGVTEQNMDRLLRAFNSLDNAYKQQSADSLFESAGKYVTDAFRKNVFDYEVMLSKLANMDFKTKIADTLRAAAKAASVTLANEAISKLTDRAGLTLEAEAKATGHIISTQAIAGAGTRNVGVAGSVAITVLNAETSATVADGGEVRVSGEMTVAADETRSVKNIASAALNDKGDADANKSAGSKETKDAGGGSDGQSIVKNEDESVKFTITAGGTAEIRQGDKADKRPKLYFTLKDGYKMPEGDKVSFSYTDGTGFEVIGALTAHQDGDGWYVDTRDEELKQADDKAVITLELEPEEILHKVAAPNVDFSQVSLGEGAAKVSVKGRDAEKDESGKETLSARVGELVEISIDKTKVEGGALRFAGYSWTDQQGINHDVELKTDGSESAGASKAQAYAPTVSNEKEIVYTFTMPDGEITDILVVFDKESGQAEESKTKAKDATGKGVGVGAAFSMVYGDSRVNASVGQRGTGILETGALSVTALSDHTEDIASAAGTDPLADGASMDDTKKYAVDASVALNILDNTVTAAIAGENIIEANGYGEGEGKKDGSLKVTATENSVNETTSSAYAVGGATAVGASAAVNIASSAVKADMSATARIMGGAEITAKSHSEDVTRAIATAMGADIGRALKKLGETTDNIEKKTNKLLDGSYAGSIGKDDKKKDNKTADLINGKLDGKKQGDGKESSGANSLSSNVLRTQGVSAQGENAGQEGTQEAQSQIKDKTGQDVSTNREKGETKWQVAAAVGVTVASHAAETTVYRIAADKEITIGAENTGNFNTVGTGAAMSFAEHANSIAAGVAVSVNENKAKAQVDSELESREKKDITVTSRLTQNMDGNFRGKLAAQALSGSVAGKDSDVAIAGAVSVAVSEAESAVNVRSSKAAPNRLSGGNITVEATDQSKLAVRAGGVSLSGGSSFGMGLSSATVVSKNIVTAAVGDSMTIEGASFKLNAEKQAVTQADYKNLIDKKYLVTDSSALTEEQQKEANTGLIDVHKGKNEEGEDEKSYTMDINLSSEKLLDAVDGLNFLSSQNTYVEAITGSVMYGGGKANLAGSIAVAVTNNKVNAALGGNASIRLTGDMSVTALSGSEDKAAATRIIAGSLSAAPAKVSVGATVAVLVDNDQVKAETAASEAAEAPFDVGGSFTHKAVTNGEIQVFTAAMAIAAGVDAGDALGGAVNVIVTKNQTESTVGGNTGIAAKKAARIGSDTRLDLIAISGSANVAAGSVAAGGVVNVIVDNAKAETALGRNAKLTGFTDAEITSSVNDRLLTGTASMSAAPKSGSAIAGVANVIVSNSKAETTLDESARVGGGTEGDVKITAGSGAYLINAGLSLAGASTIAVGGAFNVNVLNRQALVNMKGQSQVNTGGDVTVHASGKDTKILAALSAAGGISGAAFSGNAAVLVENSKIKTILEDGSRVSAGKNAVLEAHYTDMLVDAAGSIALSGGSAAVGVTGVVAVKNNEVKTSLGEGTAISRKAYDGSVTNLSGEKVQGIYVGASAKETQYIGGAGIAATGGAAVNGVVTVLVNKNQVSADASKASLTSLGQEETLNNCGYVSVRASDDTKQLLLAGGLSGSGSAAVGAAVVTVVSNKTVEAKAGSMDAGKEAAVSAENKDDIKQLAFSAGVSGGPAIQIGAAVQVLKTKVTAQAAENAQINIHEDGLTVSAKNDTTLYNVGAAIAGSGSAAATPVGTVTYFQGESIAEIQKGARVTVKKDISVTATGHKDVKLYSVGVAVGAGLGLSGTANVLVSRDKTKALVDFGASLKSANGGLTVDAQGDYKLRAMTGSLAGGTAGVAINAVVSVLKSSVTASMGGAVNVKNGNIKVNASGKRDVISAAATVGAGAAGIGAGVMVLVSGAKMSQDAADMLMYGNESEREKDRDHKKVFDTDVFMRAADAGGGSQYYDYETETDENGETKTVRNDQTLAGMLKEDVKGNGHKESEQSVGSVGGSGKPSFDAVSTYRSKDLDTNGTSIGKFNDDSDTGRGENQEFDRDSSDVQKAKNLNDYSSVYNKKAGDTLIPIEPEDAVLAAIANTAVIDSAGEITVSASQPVAADLIGATVGAGMVGGGVSVAVAILRSNVLASSYGEIWEADKVTVSASSKNVEFSGDENRTERDSSVKDYLTNKPGSSEKVSLSKELSDKLTKRGIRAFGLAAGAGVVGVGVSVGVVLTDNITEAALGGTVFSTNDVEVKASHNYGSVMAATGALGGGAVGAGASAAVAQANGAVKAVIDRDAHVVSLNGDVSVATDSSVGADALAVTAGLGAVGVNAGIALAFNRLEQETGIRANADVTAGKNVLVQAASETDSSTYLLGVALGAAGVSLNAAVSDVAANINTYIGQHMPTQVGDTSDTMPAAVVKANQVTIRNSVNSAAVPRVLSFAGGGAALGGNVLLAFNDTSAEAKAENADITAAGLSVTGDLGGKAESSLAAASVGSMAVGVSVNYADMRALNIAAVYNSRLDISGAVNIKAGMDSKKSTSALAETVAGNMGLITVGLNAAVARNNARNFATLVNSKRRLDAQGNEITNLPVRTMDMGSLIMQTGGSASAKATMTGLQISGVNVAGSFVIAVNDAVSKTEAVTDTLNAPGGLTFDSNMKGTTDALLKTGGGSILDVKLNVALAYGRTGSLVNAAIDGGGRGKPGQGGARYAFVKSTNRGSNTTTADIANQSYSAISMAAMYGAAYTQDIYSSKIQLTGGNFTIDQDVDMLTDYDLKTVSNVTPSAGGLFGDKDENGKSLSISLLKIAANIAMAKNTAQIGTEFETSIGESAVNGNIRVLSQGSDTVDANVRTAKIAVDAVKVGANIARADLSATQYAALTMGGRLNVGRNVAVRSVTGREVNLDDLDDGSPGDVENSAKATAKIASNGLDSANDKGKDKGGFEIGLVNLAASSAVARENMTNSALVRGGAYGTEEVTAQVDLGYYEMQETEEDDYEFVKQVNYTLNYGNKKYTITSNESEEKVMKQMYAYYAEKFSKDQNVINMMTIKEYGLMLYQNYRYVASKGALAMPNFYNTDKWKKALVFENGNYNSVLSAITSYMDRVKMDEDWQKSEIEYTDENTQKLMNILLNSKDDSLDDISYLLSFMLADSSLFNWEEAREYGKKKVYKPVWVESLQDMQVLQPLYDTDQNFLTADSLDVYSGVANVKGKKAQTSASASTAGGDEINFVALGSMIADSQSSDSFSALLEGMHAAITGGASLKAESNTKSEGVGFKSGTYSLASGTTSNMTAQIGKKTDPQTVSVVVGEGAELKAGHVDISAINSGNMRASMDKGTNVSLLGNVSSSTQPTKAWYSTIVSIGPNAAVTSTNGDLNIRTQDTPTATSTAEGKSLSILINFDYMKGDNQISQENNLDIGEGAKLNAAGALSLIAEQSTIATAQTLNNSTSAINVSEIKALNTIDRVARVNIGSGAKITAGNSSITIQAISGGNDNIFTKAYTDGDGLVSVPQARANAEVTSNTEIIVGGGVQIEGGGSVTLEAKSVSNHKGKAGVDTVAGVDGLGIIAIPNASAKSTLNFDTYIGVNQGGENNPTSIKAGGGSLLIRSTTEGLVVSNDALASGKGGIGVTNATAWTVANLQNVVWVDNASLAGSGVALQADNGEGGGMTHVIGSSKAALKSIAGKVVPTTRISGTQINQIRTNKVDAVDKPQAASHTAAEAGVNADLKADYVRNEIVLHFLFFDITIPLAKAEVKKELDWYVLDRCDFCGTGEKVDVKPTEQGSIFDRYDAAYKQAMAARSTVRDAARAIAGDASAEIAMRLAKGLIELTYLDTLVSRPSVVFKARYGVEKTTDIEKLYALDVESFLQRDVTLESLDRFLIWTNSRTQMDVRLLPNATRVVTYAGNYIQYVSDALTLEDENGGKTDVDIITTLTGYAAENPVIPVGKDGQLDFSTGVFTMPQQAEMELLLEEVSAAWLLESFGSGFLRTLIADQDAINGYILGGGAMPRGEISETLLPGGEADGVRLYWIGTDPEGLTDTEETLLCLMVNEATDEARAYRLTVGMMERGEDPVPVSLYLYRDSESDRREEEKYNVMFFDTPAGRESVVRIVTDTLESSAVEMPRPLRVTLRAVWSEGVDWPMYAIGSHLFVMNDGTDGKVSLLGGLYTASFDGDAFESDYILIQGIADGALTVTLKEGQPVWPEWTGEDTARDIGGKTYILIDGQWEEAVQEDGAA